MSSLPGIHDALALLDSIKEAAGAIAAREDHLEQEFTRACNKELNTHETAVCTLETRLAEFSSQAEAMLDETEERRTGKFQQRTIAINRAHAAARKNAARAAEREEARLNEEVRAATARTELDRDAALAAEAERYQGFRQAIDSGDATLVEREAEAHGAFAGMAGFRRRLARHREEPDFTPEAEQLFSEFERTIEHLAQELRHYRQRPGPKFFRIVPPWLSGGLLFAAGSAPVWERFNLHLMPAGAAYSCLGALAGLSLIYWRVRRAASAQADEIARDLFKARRLLDGCHEKSALWNAAETQRIRDTAEAAIHTLNQEWKQRIRDLADARLQAAQTLDAKLSRAVKCNMEHFRRAVDSVKSGQSRAIEERRRQAAEEIRRLTEAHKERMSQLKARHVANWAALDADWRRTTAPLWSAVEAANNSAKALFPPWDRIVPEEWAPPTTFHNAALLGRLEVNLPLFAGKMPRDRRLAPPGGMDFSLPLALAFPDQGSVLFETGAGGAPEANAAITSLIFRLLAAAPPGRLNFTIFDPVGLGQNFASLMHLADYEESSINSRIWTQTGQFEEKLSELNDHMEKVIQMYLRNEYRNIAEYNAQAGATAEKYHFLIIASFPAGFSDLAARRLRNIAANGARCGVYTFIQWDSRTMPPAEAGLEELRKNSINLKHTASGFEFAGRKMNGLKAQLETPPPAETATRFLHSAGKSSKNSTRVEVPFATVAPTDAQIWSQETAEELRVAVGRSGAAKLQYLAIGKATRQHALIAGKTGSGKSTLFHIIITNLSLWCRPEQVEFYLVDFKKGVEFKCYATRKLPHARVVAIESDREFGLSVLQRVDDELRRRGDLFREAGAQDLAGYQRAGGTQTVPRTLLMIDEFQEFFTEEDRISQGAAVLLDRIVRQGRAFGIHVILGSQTLGGAYTLARATIGQMVIRIALQCNEADAYLIMDQDNPAPRLLTRPGEGIYNDAAGSIEGNSPFQAVWISDQDRDAQLSKIRAHADRTGNRYPGPIVFEGNAPADVRENALLEGTLQSKPGDKPALAKIWLGAPNSIKGPTEVVFQRQSGSHLLVVGQSEERTVTGLGLALLALAAQFPRGTARFVTLESCPPGSREQEFFRQAAEAVPHDVLSVNNANLEEVFSGLATELKRREEEGEETGPEIFVLLHGLQQFKKLRAEDEFSFSSDDAGAPKPATVLGDLLREGAARGIHVLATCDTCSTANRFLGRKLLGEFDARVLFQMSATDSASLVDDPAASTLGLYRALLYRHREGNMETFRPYARPGDDWLSAARELLRRPPGE